MYKYCTSCGEPLSDEARRRTCQTDLPPLCKSCIVDLITLTKKAMNDALISPLREIANTLASVSQAAETGLTTTLTETDDERE